MTRFTTVDEGTALSFDAVTAAGAVVGTLTYTIVPSRFYAFSLTDNGVFAQKRQVRCLSSTTITTIELKRVCVC